MSNLFILYISKIENNSAACIDEKILDLIKERLSITKTTLTTNDITEQKNLLYKWLGMMKHRQIEEANTLKPELEELVKESGDPDIEILFIIFNSYLLYFGTYLCQKKEILLHLKAVSLVCQKSPTNVVEMLAWACVKRKTKLF